MLPDNIGQEDIFQIFTEIYSELICHNFFNLYLCDVMFSIRFILLNYVYLQPLTVKKLIYFSGKVPVFLIRLSSHMQNVHEKQFTPSFIMQLLTFWKDLVFSPSFLLYNNFGIDDC